MLAAMVTCAYSPTGSTPTPTTSATIPLLRSHIETNGFVAAEHERVEPVVLPDKWFVRPLLALPDA
jgi:hypothetical protein